jgi:hypothetical protein
VIVFGVTAAWREASDVIVPFPVPRERLRVPTSIRSTLVASSLRSLREHGYFDRYLAVLEERWREPILNCVAGVWLPLGAGLAHYRACDSLGVSSLEHMAIGREVGDRIQGTFIGTMIRAAKGAGANPWVAFPYTPKLYERLFDGGACQIVRVGPKDAEAEIAANPLLGLAYFRNGLRGMWQTGIELFCRRAYLAEVDHTDTSCRIKVSWV